MIGNARICWPSSKVDQELESEMGHMAFRPQVRPWMLHSLVQYCLQTSQTARGLVHLGASMTFPNYPHKHTDASTPLVTPVRYVRYLRERGSLEGYVAPEGIILLYQRGFARELLAQEPHRTLPLYQEWLHVLEPTPSPSARRMSAPKPPPSPAADRLC
jgi:hypothetical protein